jgi:hypothetical protein
MTITESYTQSNQAIKPSGVTQYFTVQALIIYAISSIIRIIVLFQIRPSARRGLKFTLDRHLRSKRRCSCVLQFTRLHAVSCVLHRPTSRVIHHSRLFFYNFLFLMILHNNVLLSCHVSSLFVISAANRLHDIQHHFELDSLADTDMMAN